MEKITVDLNSFRRHEIWSGLMGENILEGWERREDIAGEENQTQSRMMPKHQSLILKAQV